MKTNKIKMYHATKSSNLVSILEKGILASPEGIVYLTEKPEDAAKFLAIRMETSIISIGVKVDPAKVEEQFDHNEKFFGCRAFGYKGNIKKEDITDFIEYDLTH